MNTPCDHYQLLSRCQSGTAAVDVREQCLTASLKRNIFGGVIDEPFVIFSDREVLG